MEWLHYLAGNPNLKEAALSKEATALIEKDWAKKVLSFWFEELKPEDWFQRKDATDAAIRSRFADLHRSLFQAAPSMPFDDADTALAAILVFDQFSRNMFRGEARAFATDDLALLIARRAVERGFDSEAPAERRRFFYMPFMHSENAADQERCVALFSALPGDTVKYAREHRDIVARFGRFPHRNRVLGREDTPAEHAFLSEHKGFGQ
jgi:uncharacterized protein (DUF924 family)